MTKDQWLIDQKLVKIDDWLRSMTNQSNIDKKVHLMKVDMILRLINTDNKLIANWQDWLTINNWKRNQNDRNWLKMIENDWN